jgi:FKBP-type peptidyl-prolyl cis-trans isomerase
MFKDVLTTLGLGLNLLSPAQSPGIPVEDLVLGKGPEIASGQLLTVHFIVSDEGGVELANSRKRGLPFTFKYAAAGDDLFARIVPGMHVGGQRRVHLPAELAYGAAGLPPLVPANQPIVVVVTVLKAGDR